MAYEVYRMASYRVQISSTNVLKLISCGAAYDTSSNLDIQPIILIPFQNPFTLFCARSYSNGNLCSRWQDRTEKVEFIIIASNIGSFPAVKDRCDVHGR